MLKKIQIIIFILLLTCAASSAFGATSEIIVTDCDPTGKSKNLQTIIESWSYYLPDGTPKGDSLEWNISDMFHQTPTNTAELAEVPDASVFSDLLSADNGPIEVKIHMRIKLPLEKASITLDANKLGTISLAYYTNEMHGIMKFMTQAWFSDPLTELVNIEKFVVVGADGSVQSLKAKPYYPYTYVENDQYGNVWDTQSTFPMKVYGVSYKYLEHGITVTQPENGTIAPFGESGDVKVKHGENAEFTITANSGCRIAWLLVDGQRVAAENKYLCTYTFTGVTENHTISAVFEEDSRAPVAAGDSGVTASVSDVVSSASDAAVAALEAGGFVSGGKTLHVVDTDKDTKMEGSFTADAGGFVQAVKLKADYEEGSESKGLTLTVKPADAAKPFSADKKYYALLLNKKTNYYDVFPASLNGEGNLAVRIKPVGDYFSEGTIFIYSGSLYVSETPVSPDDPVNPSAGSKSGGGCRTGIAAFALLSLLPLLRKRR